ncbi:Flp pilus assembly protein CpaB [Paenibacillus thermotolerans]|uniref:Flp pilus assembly protein CpaB n=1 Tax=Paenibacillus thermotolerans TaxID=3027807 RepID=UPI00236866CB|nr:MULTISPECIES: Flp pilus assembly protein CpaB [unclassified Paenibacillus]
MRTKMVLILAIVMGAVTTVLFYQYMNRFQQEAAASEVFVEVVTAKEPIAKNEIITAAKLTIARVPELGVHPNAVTTISSAEGKIANASIAAGEVLLTHRFQDTKEEALFVSRKVKEGYRAVSVGVDFVRSVSNLIEPEDYVDVIYSKVDMQTKEVITKLLLEKVRVLAVGRRMVESETDTPYVEYSSATLELNKDQTVVLVNAIESGTIHLTLHTRVSQQETADKAENK